MIMYRVLLDGEVIASRVGVAESFIRRMVGLLRHKKIDRGEGLLIRPCCQVHTFYMHFDIDVLFLSKTGEILYIEESLGPGMVSPFVKKCYQVLELKSGTVKEKGIMVGNRVAFDLAD